MLGGVGGVGVGLLSRCGLGRRVETDLLFGTTYVGGTVVGGAFAPELEGIWWEG